MSQIGVNPLDFWILKKSGVISGSIKLDKTVERFEDISKSDNFDPLFIDFYNEDGTDQDLWTKAIGEVFGNKIRNDLNWMISCIGIMVQLVVVSLVWCYIYANQSWHQDHPIVSLLNFLKNGQSVNHTQLQLSVWNYSEFWSKYIQV